MGAFFVKNGKRGLFFCLKKWKMGGVFLLKKVENGVFCKKVDLSSTQGALCTVSVFFILHFTYLGGAYAPNAPPSLPTGLGPGRPGDIDRLQHDRHTAANVSSVTLLADVGSSHRLVFADRSL